MTSDDYIKDAHLLMDLAHATAGDEDRLLVMVEAQVHAVLALVAEIRTLTRVRS